MAAGMTVQEVLNLPVSVDVPTAGKALGIGRTAAYQAAKDGSFPVPVFGVGRTKRVTRASLLAALGIQDPAVRMAS